MFFEWEKLFVSILDKHAPIRQHKVRNKYAPHINAELKRKMTQIDFYKRKHRSTKDPQDWQEYKKLRNIVNREIDKAKKDYFMHKISGAKNDVKATWKVLNSALGRQSKTTSFQQLRVKDTIYSQPETISEQMNQYFCNVANEILKDSEGYSSSSELFESTLKKIPKPNKVFKFRRITPKDVVDHVSKLKTSRSGAIPTRFLKTESMRLLILYLFYLISQPIKEYFLRI